MTARQPMEAAMFPRRQEGGEVAAGRAAMPDTEALTELLRASRRALKVMGGVQDALKDAGLGSHQFDAEVARFRAAIALAERGA
jgi:uncharacterized protein YjiS (DUF1127 family)